MAFYDDMAAVAVELLNEFGTPVVLPRVTGGSYDPVTGETTAGSDESATTIGLIKPYPDNLIDGTRIRSTDKMLVITAAVEPLMTDTPQMGGTTLGSVVGIKTVNPAGIPICYFVQVRA
tara:strand:- start:21717 stop:22073 length:357 start_codon:yes stop_codon:yes gene_type:complete